uniref:DH domain-containing protein n=1 Tax=Micrurus corallinus TaxID=54390 RepID=A0A2D4GQD1_MICCO
MQRLTKYPLLLDNIAKYSEQPLEKDKVKKAADHCRQILNFVNQAVKEAENKQHLEDYQRRLDLSYLKQVEGPLLDEFRVSGRKRRGILKSDKYSQMYFVVLSASLSTQFYCLQYLDFEIIPQSKKNGKYYITHHIWGQFCSGHRWTWIYQQVGSGYIK